MKEKGFAPVYLLIGLLIVAAISGAYYFGKLQSPIVKCVSNNIDEIVTWKTYIGKPLLNFTVKHPSNWEVKEDYNDARKYYQQVSMGEGISDYLSIVVQNNSGNETPEKFAEGIVGGCSKSNNKSSVIVDGIQSLMYLPDPDKQCNTGRPGEVTHGISNYEVYIPKDKLIFIIYFSNKQDDLLPKILSTFKFN